MLIFNIKIIFDTYLANTGILGSNLENLFLLALSLNIRLLPAAN